MKKSTLYQKNYLPRFYFEKKKNPTLATFFFFFQIQSLKTV